MFQACIAFLSLTALVSGLDGDKTYRVKAERFVLTEVEAAIRDERSLKTAPQRWYDCMSQIKNSKVLKREIMRLYLEDERMRLSSSNEIVRKAALDLCGDEFYRY